MNEKLSNLTKIQDTINGIDFSDKDVCKAMVKELLDLNPADYWADWICVYNNILNSLWRSFNREDIFKLSDSLILNFFSGEWSDVAMTLEDWLNLDFFTSLRVVLESILWRRINQKEFSNIISVEFFNKLSSNEYFIENWDVLRTLRRLLYPVYSIEFNKNADILSIWDKLRINIDWDNYILMIWDTILWQVFVNDLITHDKYWLPSITDMLFNSQQLVEPDWDINESENNLKIYTPSNKSKQNSETDFLF